MQNIKESIEYLQRCLKFYNCNYLTLEDIRTAKLDNQESLLNLKLSLSYLILLNHSNYDQSFKINTLKDPDFIINLYLQNINKEHFLYNNQSSKNILILIAYVIQRIEFFQTYRVQSYQYQLQQFENNNNQQESIARQSLKHLDIIECYNMIQKKLTKIEKLRNILDQKTKMLKGLKISVDDLQNLQNKQAFEDKIKRYQDFLNYLQEEQDSYKHEQLFFIWMEQIVSKIFDIDDKEDYKFDNQEIIKKQYNINYQINQDFNCLKEKYEILEPKFNKFLKQWEQKAAQIQQDDQLFKFYQTNSSNILKQLSKKYIDYEKFKQLIDEKYEANLIFDILLNIQDENDNSIEILVNQNKNNLQQLDQNKKLAIQLFQQLKHQLKNIVKMT